jgi:predicted SprT family Zn-dependent metalloprotease
MNVIGVALEELYRIFAILNHDKFNDDLPEPVITIQKTTGSVLGHFTPYKAWKNKQNVENDNIETDDSDETAYHEINIDPRWFCNRTAEEVVETLLHEMCHYYNKLADINDCNGSNHNKKFKSMAEKVGLIVEKGKSVGWGYTSLSDELKKYIEESIKPNEKAFEYFRSGNAISEGVRKPRTKTLFVYTCPDCGQTAKGKKDIELKCGVCDVNMEIEDEESED